MRVDAIVRNDISRSGRPRVLYLIGGLDPGGAERQLLYLAEGVARVADVTVVSLSTSAIGLLPQFQRIPGVTTLMCAKHRKIDLTLIPRLIRLLRRERPMILHTVLRTANYWGRVAGIMARIPIVIAGERNVEVERGRVSNCLDGLLARVTDRIIVNASAIRDHLIRVEGVDPRTIDVVSNGVEVPSRSGSSDTVRLRQQLGIDDDAPLVAFVGRLTRQKNPARFLTMADAVRRHGLRCHFLLIGNGPLRPALEAQARALDLHGLTRFLGQRDDVGRILESVDLLVQTSDWEGMPNVVLEASAAGVPVVATDVGGVREIIAEAVTGHVVPASDVSLLVDRVVQLLGDAGRRHEYGERARRLVQDRFSLEAMVTRTLEIYNALLQHRGFPSVADTRPRSPQVGLALEPES
jgi:glycosyltransferase involved in cell wall biosynthesis